MRNLILRAATAACLLAYAVASQGQAPGLVRFVSSQLEDATGTVIANATLSAQIVVGATPASVRLGSGGQASMQPVTVQVVNGMIASPTFYLPDVNLTSPQNVCIAVTVTDNTSGSTLISDPCVQPSSSTTSPTAQQWCSTANSATTCNFDLYTPNFAPQALIQTGPQGPQGPPLNVRGAWSGSASYAAGDVVSYSDGNIYLCLGSCVGVAPGSGGVWIALRLNPSLPEVRVAASNSLRKAGADMVCSGAQDDTCITAAMQLCAAQAACTVLLQNGIYYVANPVTIDRDDITLTGENHCMWGGYNAPWTSTSSPAGSIGSGCAQLRATAPGFNLVNLVYSTPSGNSPGDTRHRGIRVTKLYLVGDNYTGTGIAALGSLPDNSMFDDNVIQRTLGGINVTADSPIIRDNSIQDIAGDGITTGGVLPLITNNLIFDIGGHCVVNTANEANIIANRLGDCTGLSIAGSHNHVQDNVIGGINGTAVALVSCGLCVVQGNTFDYYTQAYGFGFNLNGQTCTSCDVVTADAGTPGAVIQNNTFDTRFPMTGKAVNVLAAVDTKVTGNLVDTRNYWGEGAFLTGANNNISPGNFVAFNTLNQLGAVGPAPVTSAIALGWFKADSLLLSDGAPVASWPDSSGATTPLMHQGTGMPIYKAASTISSKPAVRFDGSEGFVGTSFAAPGNARTRTVFVVFNPSSIPTTAAPAGSTAYALATPSIINGDDPLATTTPQTNALVIDPNTRQLASYAGSYGVSNAAALTAGTPYVVEMTVGASTTTFSVNGTQSAPLSVGTYTWANGLRLASNAAGNGGYFTGDMGEAIVYSNSLSTADAQAVGAALCAKYAVTCGTAW